MIEILAHVYSSESAQQEPSNEYKHDGVKMVFKNDCVLMLWTEVALALEWLCKSSMSCLQRGAYRCNLVTMHFYESYLKETLSSVTSAISP